MSGASTPGRTGTPTSSASYAATAATAARPGSASPSPLAPGTPLAVNKSSPNTAMQLDNTSRKQLYAICAASPSFRCEKGDILSLDLSPKEDGQPVIMVTFSHNATVVLKVALPCASIAALQMYPYITVFVSGAPGCRCAGLASPGPWAVGVGAAGPPCCSCACARLACPAAGPPCCI
jgi:hypothetical protein